MLKSHERPCKRSPADLLLVADQRANTFVGKNLQQRRVRDSTVDDMRAGDTIMDR